ncbi:MAG TPA: ATP synthase F1 subunit gamma [Chitinispirillaceae bacterium]|nr:ATP synthase F1 subunit gamma [Chitinispirillaceae bacterium]
MQGIREYNKKITSLKNTRKITSSMKMISSVKLQRFSKMRQNAAPFWQTAQTALDSICSIAGDTSVLCNGYPQSRKAMVLLFSSDRGLCGRFNTNAIRKALQLLEELTSDGKRECIFCFAGTKGHAFFKRQKLPVESVYEGVSIPDYSTSSGIADDLLNKYTNGDVQEVWIVYTRKAGLVEEPFAERLLPFEYNRNVTSGAQNALLEESSIELLNSYARIAVRAKIYKAHMESTVSEHNARMSAMETATTNCDQMIQRYIKLRNRARQTAITTELSEIVSGKEAIDN